MKLEITETCISSKKWKKMLDPYGEIALRKNQVDRFNKKGDPYNKFSFFISMHADKIESSWMELLLLQKLCIQLDYSWGT